MKRIILFLSILATVFIQSELTAQTIEKEASYLLDGKARRGRLAQVEVADNGNYKLYYITKAKTSKVKFLIYTFTPDFEFVSKEEDEIELEKVKTKYSWFNFKGELYTVQGITMNWNPVMPLVLKKKEITYKYDWLLLGYYKTVKVLDKVKPRTDDGMKYFAKKYFEDEVTGDIYIVAGVAPGGLSKKAGDQLIDMRILKFDFDLNLLGETKIPFEYGQEVAFAQGFAEADPENPESVGFKGGAIVFAPTVWKGSSAPVDKEKGNFTYVQFDENLNIEVKESFVNPSPGWAIDGMQWMANDKGEKEVYIYGPAAFGKDKYYNVAVQSGKKKSIQLMKVGDGKIQYLTESNIEDIAAVKKMPSTHKKTFDYNGKSKLSFQFTPLSSGNIVLYGQYYNEGKPGDYSAMEFNGEGKLVANYTKNMATGIKVKYAVPHEILENSNGAYWISYEAEGDESTKNIVPVITKIDSKAKEIKDPLVLGKVGKKQTYFIDKSYPMLGVSETEQVYFGSDKREKNIWFCRVKL
jgi:hypothetical protein